MLTSSSGIRSDTIMKVALHILNTSIPSRPFITIAVLQLKFTVLCARCNAVTHQRNVKVFNFHTILWNDTRWYFWDEKQSMQQFWEKKTSEGVKEYVKCIELRAGSKTVRTVFCLQLCLASSTLDKDLNRSKIWLFCQNTAGLWKNSEENFGGISGII